MDTPLHGELRYHTRKPRNNFGALYSASVLFIFHWSIVAYINSTLLEHYIPNTTVGLLYTVSAILTIISFLSISRILRRIGNYKLTLVLAVLELLILVGLGTATSATAIITYFVVHQFIVPLVFFNLDIFMEEMIGDNENTTGSKRGLILGIMSVAGAVAALASGYLLGSDDPNFSYAYFASALVVALFIGIIVWYFKTFKDPAYDEPALFPTLREFWARKDIRNVFASHFLLQLFFVWTVVYIPLFMATQTSFNWEEIGLILFVGLMAYVFLEYPIGIVADRWIGEKEMMAIGFVILSISTAWISFIATASIGVWMFVMFMTRVGASFIEATTESYFFKHTDGTDAHIISFFRMSRPLSYVVGSLLGSLILVYLPFNFTFLTLGLILVAGLFSTMALRDTK